MKTAETKTAKLSLAALALAASFGALAPLASLAMMIGPITDTLDGTSTAYSPRMTRNGVSSTCAGKAFPGTFSQSFTFNSYAFFNSGPAECVTVLWWADDGSFRSFLSAYLSSFDPSNLALNYLGDSGISASFVPRISFEFLAPADSQFLIVANSVFGLASNTYSFTLSGDSISRVGAVPEPVTLALLAFGLAGLAASRRRKQ